jgi:putative lipoprotein
MTLILSAALAGALLATGCGGGGDGGEEGATAQVTGTVTYLQRMALPDDAEVRVVLQDISLQDAPARTVASASIVTEGKQVPIPFVIAYDPAQINEARTYSVHAEIHIDGVPRFVSTQSYPVITREAPSNVDIVVMALERQAQTLLVGTYWKLVQIAGKDVIPAADAKREPHLTLLPEDNRAFATGGCNQMTGSYQMTATGLLFSEFISTKMACPAVMEQEHALGQALAATTAYRLEGSTLALLDAKGATLARFEAAAHEE